MVKFMLIGIVVCWVVAFMFPAILKMIKHFKGKVKKDDGKTGIEEP